MPTPPVDAAPVAEVAPAEVALAVGISPNNAYARRDFAELVVATPEHRHLAFEARVAASPSYRASGLAKTLAALGVDGPDAAIRIPVTWGSVGVRGTAVEGRFGPKGPAYAADWSVGAGAEWGFLASPCDAWTETCPAAGLGRGAGSLSPAASLGLGGSLAVARNVDLRAELRERVALARPRSAGLQASIGVAWHPTVERRAFVPAPRDELPGAGFAEVLASAGAVANDPFVTTALVGGSVIVHPSDRLSARVNLGVSPSLAPHDLTAAAKRLQDQSVSPDVSRIQALGGAELEFDLARGTFGAAGRPLTVYGDAGLGAVNTVDDLEALQCPGDPLCEATARQLHLTTAVGVGVRAFVADRWSLRFDARWTRYVETIASTTLEMKTPLLLSVGLSYGAPPPLAPPDDRPAAVYFRGTAGVLGWPGSGTSFGSVLRNAPIVGLGIGHAFETSHGAITVELGGRASQHNGLHWQLQEEEIRAGQLAPDDATQGDTLLLSGLAQVGYLYDLGDFGLGAHAGGGVLAAPSLMGPFSDLRMSASIHQRLHPTLLAGPSAEVRPDKLLAIGVEGDVVYATGFHLGASGQVYVRAGVR